MNLLWLAIIINPENCRRTRKSWLSLIAVGKKARREEVRFNVGSFLIQSDFAILEKLEKNSQASCKPTTITCLLKAEEIVGT